MSFRFHPPNEAAIAHASRISDETWDDYRLDIEREFYAGGLQGYKQAHHWIERQAIDDFTPTLRQVRYRLKQTWNCQLLTRKEPSLGGDSDAKSYSGKESLKADKIFKGSSIEEEETVIPSAVEGNASNIVFHGLSDHGAADPTGSIPVIRCRKREESPVIDHKRMKRQESGDDLRDIEHLGDWTNDPTDDYEFDTWYTTSPPRYNSSNFYDNDTVSVSNISDMFAEVEIGGDSAVLVEEPLDTSRHSTALGGEPEQVVESTTESIPAVKSIHNSDPGVTLTELTPAFRGSKIPANSLDHNVSINSSSGIPARKSTNTKQKSFAFEDHEGQPRDGG